TVRRGCRAVGGEWSGGGAGPWAADGQAGVPGSGQLPGPPAAETRGTAAVADGLGAWLASYAVGPGYEVHHLHVGGADDVGYCAFRYHVSGRLHDGAEVDMWVRSTLVCRRVDGAWRIVHQHESVPFDPATGAGLVSEAPDD
ncbi:MAG: YybH family protein, partial [Aeromicrobium sp.]